MHNYEIRSFATFHFTIQVNYLLDEMNETITESAWCGPPFNDPQTSWEALVTASTVIFFILPTLLLFVLYLRIAQVLENSKKLRRCASTDTGKRCDMDRTQVQSRRVVIRMLGKLTPNSYSHAYVKLV